MRLNERISFTVMLLVVMNHSNFKCIVLDPFLEAVVGVDAGLVSDIKNCFIRFLVLNHSQSLVFL